MAYYEDCVIFLLAKAYQKAHAKIKARVKQYGITPIQHLVLEALWDEEGLYAVELSKNLSLDNATLSGVLERLEEGGWIIKRVDEEDRRYIRVYLTKKGKDFRSELIEERKLANEDILSEFSLEEKVLFKRMLRDISQVSSSRQEGPNRQ
mgnify:CR=1 FL=1